MSKSVKMGKKKQDPKKTPRAFTDLKMYNLENSINTDMSSFEPEMAESERRSWEDVSEFKAG